MNNKYFKPLGDNMFAGALEEVQAMRKNTRIKELEAELAKLKGEGPKNHWELDLIGKLEDMVNAHMRKHPYSAVTSTIHATYRKTLPNAKRLEILRSALKDFNPRYDKDRAKWTHLRDKCRELGITVPHHNTFKTGIALFHDALTKHNMEEAVKNRAKKKEAERLNTYAPVLEAMHTNILKTINEWPQDFSSRIMYYMTYCRNHKIDFKAKVAEFTQLWLNKVGHK